MGKGTQPFFRSMGGSGYLFFSSLGVLVLATGGFVALVMHISNDLQQKKRWQGEKSKFKCHVYVHCISSFSFLSSSFPPSLCFGCVLFEMGVSQTFAQAGLEPCDLPDLSLPIHCISY
jgi:hypothetical protein